MVDRRMDRGCLMGRLVSVFTLVLIFCSSIAQAEDEKIVFDLYPQTRPYIYSVGFKYDGVDRWYQIEVSAFRAGEVTKVVSDVFYDSISRNFYAVQSGVVTIIPINQPHELRFHKTAKH
jgi:hypothetical protein